MDGKRKTYTCTNPYQGCQSALCDRKEHISYAAAAMYSPLAHFIESSSPLIFQNLASTFQGVRVLSGGLQPDLDNI